MKYLLITIFLFGYLSLEASPYGKAGVTLLSTDDLPLPTLGIGLRDLEKGYDFSLNTASLLVSNFVSFKGLYAKRLNGYLYGGMGGAVSYRADLIPMGGPLGGRDYEQGELRLEALLGFGKKGYFLQIEPSLPLCALNGPTRFHPGLSCCAGIRF